MAFVYDLRSSPITLIQWILEKKMIKGHRIFSFCLRLPGFLAKTISCNFRSWFFSENNRAGETFNFGITLQFLDTSGNEIADQIIGEIQNYDEEASYDTSFNELFYPISDLHSFDFESIQVMQTLDNVTTDGKHHLSPVEMIVDVPHDLGCFEELSDPTDTGILISETTDEMSPAWCITKCVTADAKKRYACKFYEHIVGQNLKAKVQAKKKS